MRFRICSCTVPAILSISLVKGLAHCNGNGYCNQKQSETCSTTRLVHGVGATPASALDFGCNGLSCDLLARRGHWSAAHGPSYRVVSGTGFFLRVRRSTIRSEEHTSELQSRLHL